jgi:Fe-S-cluster containining protein
VATLTAPDQHMFARHYGRSGEDLLGDNLFWGEAFVIYKDRDVPLPLTVNRASIRTALYFVNCQPGKCSDCCKYKMVSINDFDLFRLGQAGITDIDGKEEDGQKFFSSEGGCRFLKDNACSIYESRPDTCAFFPLQFGNFNEVDGKKVEQLYIRIKCVNAMNAVRQTVKYFLMNNAHYLLLPNLTVIKTEV